MEDDEVYTLQHPDVTNFNPRPPHGGRLKPQIVCMCKGQFQSTSSAWRTTCNRWCKNGKLRNFNPRPPHGGRLHFPKHFLLLKLDFNPRPPHGGRLQLGKWRVGYLIFQSTSSAWRTTWQEGASAPPAWDFNPRPPHGGRPAPPLKRANIV